MKAFELRQPGIGIEGLRLVDRSEPQPGPAEVVVAMRTAALNARDLQILAGVHPVGKAFPLVPLSDGVGEVIACGERVTRVRRGDRVAGTFAQQWLYGPRSPATWSSTLGGDVDGLLQERVLLHEDGVVKLPGYLTDEEGATLPIAAVTAWQALVIAGGLRAGDSILTRGTGGVSLFALQLGRAAGAHVIVTSRSAAKRERARALGAHETIDSTDPTWPRQVRELTGGEGVDHVVDSVGDLRASIDCLRIGGLVSQVGYLASMKLEADVFPLLLANARLQGISVGPRSTFEDLLRAMALHQVHPVVETVVPFARAPEAFAAFASEARFGKVVVRFE
jgi:NADPH:quinone reductase-like Zn-dependent oxidoreductase